MFAEGALIPRLCSHIVYHEQSNAKLNKRGIDWWMTVRGSLWVFSGGLKQDQMNSTAALGKRVSRTTVCLRKCRRLVDAALLKIKLDVIRCTAFPLGHLSFLALVQS
jgi:hypothetical protein